MRVATPFAGAPSVRGSPATAGSIELAESYRTIYLRPSGSNVRVQEREIQPPRCAHGPSPMTSTMHSYLQARDLRAAWAPFIVAVIEATRMRSPAIHAAPSAMLHPPSG